MKDWEYYSTVDVPYPRKSEMVALRRAEIDAVPMTAAERTEAYKQADADVSVEYKRLLRERQEVLNAKEDEFWQDCREELGYAEFLDEDGCKALEAYAWNEGHSGGFSEVYNYLIGLAELAEKIAEHAK